MSQITTTLKEYMAANMQVEDLDDDINILEEGLIDSMGILELAGFIEQQWGLEMEAEDMVVENFESVTAMKNFIQSKSQGA